MLQVAADITAYFYEVLPAAQGYQIGIRIGVLAEVLWVPRVGAKTDRAIIETNTRYAGHQRRAHIQIGCVAGMELVQGGRTEYPDKTELEVGGSSGGRAYEVMT